MKNKFEYSSEAFLNLFQKFISLNYKKRRIQRNGKILTKASIQNYESLFKVLKKFFQSKNFSLNFMPLSPKNTRQFLRQKKHWHLFYLEFIDFCFNDLNHFDNHVGTNLKLLKCFCHWIEAEHGIFTGSFYRDFYVFKEEIPITVLKPEQLAFLIYDKPFDNMLPNTLKKTKDFFVFGCCVGLRVSDMRALKKDNLEITKDAWYLKVYSQKNGTYTKIKLPPCAIDIITRNENKSIYLFKSKSLVNLNKQIKQIAEMAGWTYTMPKIRAKRGMPIEIYKNDIKKEHYRFCDLLSSHSMRRTAITTLLSMGMDELSVRKISGHKPGSVEFYKYVKFHQQNLDEKTDRAFEKLALKY